MFSDYKRMVPNDTKKAGSEPAYLIFISWYSHIIIFKNGKIIDTTKGSQLKTKVLW